IVNQIMLRSLKKAEYSPECKGHFGLSFKYYCHFTSPIRRYPDLVVHRLLKVFSSRGNGELTDEQREYEENLPSIASWASKRERVANEAEWDLLDMKKVEYISNHIGEVFQGVITGLTKFGIFVEITEKMISGLVHISTLDDYYDFIENQNILVGRKNKRIFRIGDDLKVQAVRADKTTMEIDFNIVEKEKKPVKKTSHEQKTRSKKPKKRHK
ncbi:MAG: RNB domain-containing ribonuclease, partial [Mesotoga sp.]|nr:RNB domain-containing ribonuclease [Mesotoga sp.]